MADFQSSLTASQIETVLTDAIVPTRGKALTEAEKLQAREYIGATALGEGIKIISHFDTLEELKAAVPNPKAGDAYSVGTKIPYSLYIFDFYHNEWKDYGAIRSDDITARLAQNIAVLPDAWEEDTDVFTDYTFKAAIPLGEITGNDFSIVAFNPSDAAGGNFCPIAYAFDGYVEIWASKKPDAEIIIPAVTFIVLNASGGTGNSTKGITNATGALPADGIGTDLLANEAVTRDKLAADVKNLAFTDIAIPDYEWQEDGTFSLYPYRAKVELPNAGIDSSYFPDVVFDENNTDLAPVADSTEGGVYVFAADYPEEIIKIKSLICTPTKAIIPVSRVFGIISVTYAAGKTVTCTDGTRTLTAKTTSGSWQFAVPNAGEWIISDGENSQTVSITAQGQTVSVALAATPTELWLFKSGEGALVSFDKYAQANASVTIGTDEITVVSNSTASNRSHFTTSEKYDLTKYSALKVEYICSSQYHAPRFGVVTTKATGAGSDTGSLPWSAYLDFSSENTRRTIDISLEGVTEGYICYNGSTNMSVYNIWLVE